MIAAVGLLTDIVDRPKRYLLRVMKFWKSKKAKDPIIAFPGAAAGSLIAELRTELEKTVVVL